MNDRPTDDKSVMKEPKRRTAPKSMYKKDRKQGRKRKVNVRTISYRKQ